MARSLKNELRRRDEFRNHADKLKFINLVRAAAWGLDPIPENNAICYQRKIDQDAKRQRQLQEKA